jgi:hypothetical protein
VRRGSEQIVERVLAAARAAGADSADALFTGATTATLFRDADQTYQVAVAPVLPGDQSC